MTSTSNLLPHRIHLPKTACITKAQICQKKRKETTTVHQLNVSRVPRHLKQPSPLICTQQNCRPQARVTPKRKERQKAQSLSVSHNNVMPELGG